jgi:poly(A) polymerase
MAQQQRRISIPKRFTIPMREMLALQPRFAMRHGKRGRNFLDHNRFRAAFDFMLLQSQVGLVDKEVADFWTIVQSQSANERAQSFAIAGPGAGKKRKRRRRRKKGGPAAGAS